MTASRDSDCRICREDRYRCAAHPRLEPGPRRRLLSRARRASRASDDYARAWNLAAENGAPVASLDAIVEKMRAAAGLALRLRRAATGRHCLDCGASFPEWKPGTSGGVGYAILRNPDGARVCYPCAEERERSDFAKADSFLCYLSGDWIEERRGCGTARRLVNARLTTWTGGTLARVEACWSAAVGYGWKPRRYYFRAIAPDGSRWHGTSPGPGMYARARRSK
jgi:hypothetical protein